MSSLNRSQRSLLSFVLGFLLLLILGRQAQLLARVLMPATAQDILDAMGPDARGVHISQDQLPDLFALTASRLDEDAKSFQVVQPYVNGRWKGGKAVIEYARDLSYTMVSIYDKDGHRQRIYSVTAKPSDTIPPPAAESTAVDSESSDVVNPGQVTEVASQPIEAESAVSEDSKSSSHARVRKTTAGSDGSTAAAGSWVGSRPFEVSYTQAKTKKSSKAPSASRAKKDTSKMVDTDIDLSAQPAAFEWNDAAGAYVPVQGGVASAAVKPPPPPAKEEVSEPAPKTTSTRSKRHRHHEEAAPVVAKAEKSSVEAGAPPASGFEWDDEKGAYVPSKGSAVTPSAAPVEEPKPSARRRHKASQEAVEKAPVVASVPAVVPPAPPMDMHPAPVSHGGGGGNTSLNSEAVPSTEELLGGAPAASEKKEDAPQPEKRVVAVSAPEPDRTPVARKTVAAPANDAALAMATAKMKKEEEKQEREQAKTASLEAAVTPSETPSAGSGKYRGPDTGDSDAWVPKAVKTKAEPEVNVKESPSVAMLSRPVDNSADALLSKAADQGTGEMPRDSDNWVPKQTKTPKADADLEAELARVRKMKKSDSSLPSLAPPARMKHDVNNPEEGVLPVSQFEKFSGPRYGRHREYERRFFVGKRAKAQVTTGYDFYVDEVDRKKEIHNVYYYKRDKKVPKLIAVERHEHVSFLTNYDVDKEDKGKLSKYE